MKSGFSAKMFPESLKQERASRFTKIITGRKTEQTVKN